VAGVRYQLRLIIFHSIIEAAIIVFELRELLVVGSTIRIRLV
jgi:hypothetical protein